MTENIQIIHSFQGYIFSIRCFYLILWSIYCFGSFGFSASLFGSFLILCCSFCCWKWRFYHRPITCFRAIACTFGVIFSIVISWSLSLWARLRAFGLSLCPISLISAFSRAAGPFCQSTASSITCACGSTTFYSTKIAFYSCLHWIQKSFPRSY